MALRRPGHGLGLVISCLVCVHENIDGSIGEGLPGGLVMGCAGGIWIFLTAGLGLALT